MSKSLLLMESDMKQTFSITNRHDEKVTFQASELLLRVHSLSTDLSPYLDPELLVSKVTKGLYSGVKTVEIDELLAETAASMTTKHPDYGLLAGRVAASALAKVTPSTFSEAARLLFNITVGSGNFKRKAPTVSEELIGIIERHKDRIDAQIIHANDMTYTYFGFKTMERSYLQRVNNKVVERPQYMLMRVALGIHGEDLESAFETYRLLSAKVFTHASSTLFNSGTSFPAMSSCFLLGMADDSLEGIFETLKTCALLSKGAGGIGLHVSNIRARGAYIASTSGYSNGLAPMLRVFNNAARYVDQGGNKRPGAIAVYLEPWHADVFDFLDMRRNHGAEEIKARDLFYALWIPDLFMTKVEKNEDWCLFSPDSAPGLNEVWGSEFEDLYNRYETEGRQVSVTSARKLWLTILDCQVETGMPFMCYKDACNSKSNQKNLGVIKSSNLCTEIMEYSSGDEVAVCNLASIALPAFVVRPLSENQDTPADEKGDAQFDFHELHRVTKVIVKNLNKVIDRNEYAVDMARRSALRHRAVAVGVQGLADTFMSMEMSYGDDASRNLNKQIFESIYHGALEASMELAAKHGCYETFQNSPSSRGELQFDMWNVKPSPLWDWDLLKTKIRKHGLRNSLLVAPMPTASTSQILGYNECFEPYTSNMYSRRVLSGDFQVVNVWLVKELMKRKIWSDKMRNRILAERGSVQNIEEIPLDVRQRFKTVWEIPQRTIIDMAADRGAFIDQSQSLNIHMSNPTSAKLNAMHFHGWKKGLKTGMYYLRTQAASNAIQFTVDQELLREDRGKASTDDFNESPSIKRVKRSPICTVRSSPGCESCSS